MFIDMSGFTSKTSVSSREELKKTLEEFEDLVLPIVKDHGGKIIKGMGDAYLITFHSPTNSIICGNEIQRKIKERNETVGIKEKFEASIGVSSGEVYERGGDIFGEPVNLASRIQSKANPGEILFGDSVYHAMNKNEIGYSSIGKHSLKGIGEKVQIYKVHGKKKGRRSGGIWSFIKRRKWWIIGILVFLFILGAGQEDGSDGDSDTEYSYLLSGDWFLDAEIAVADEDYAAMDELLFYYEDAFEWEKDFDTTLAAAYLYSAVGRYRISIETFRDALGKAESLEDRQNAQDVAGAILGELPEGSPEASNFNRAIENLG